MPMLAVRAAGLTPWHDYLNGQLNGQLNGSHVAIRLEPTDDAAIADYWQLMAETAAA